MTSKTKLVADSWEEYDNDISPPLPTPIVLARPQTERPSVWSGPNTPFEPLSGTQIRVENSTRSEYQPQIRILQKNGNSSPSKSNNYDKANASPKPAVLSFEEKQRAYEETRRRIMGDDDSSSKPNPGDDSSSKKTDDSSPRLNSIANSANSTSSSTSGLRNLTLSIPKAPPVLPPRNVVREPIGPDGTKGFNQRRS